MHFYMCRSPWEQDLCIFTCAGAPGEQDLCIFTCAGAPGEQNVCIFTCAGAPAWGAGCMHFYVCRSPWGAECMHFYVCCGPWVGPPGQYGHPCPFCPGEPGRTIRTSMSIFYACPRRLWANASTVGTELRSLTMIQGANLLTCQPVKHWFLLPGGGLPVFRMLLVWSNPQCAISQFVQNAIMVKSSSDIQVRGNMTA